MNNKFFFYLLFACCSLLSFHLELRASFTLPLNEGILDLCYEAIDELEAKANPVYGSIINPDSTPNCYVEKDLPALNTLAGILEKGELPQEGTREYELYQQLTNDWEESPESDWEEMLRKCSEQPELPPKPRKKDSPPPLSEPPHHPHRPYRPLSSILFGTLKWINLTQTSFTAALFTQQLHDLSVLSDCRAFNKSQPNCPGSFWIQPYGIWNRQEKIDHLVGFNADSHGALMSYSRRLGSFLFGLGAGYDHTDMQWKSHYGKGATNRGYGALYCGYINRFLFTSLLVMGGANVYQITRYADVDKKSYPLTSRFVGKTFNAHFDLSIGNPTSWAIPIQLIGKVDYAYFYQPAFQEKGVDLVSLKVQKQRTDMLRTELGIKYERPFMCSCMCFLPYFGVSWISKIPLQDGVVKVQLHRKKELFSTTSKVLYQAMPFIGCKIANLEKAALALDIRTEIGKRSKSYLASIRFDYRF